MIFAVLTLFSALFLAGVAGLFSILGITAIYAGAPAYALSLGVATECAKLVTTSWVYRNWESAKWKLKIPLCFFVILLMLITSIGVFGFLSKAHIEQGVSTVNHEAKIAQIASRISQETQKIADNTVLISQIDAAVNASVGADKLITARKQQSSQRKQLNADSDSIRATIDKLAAEKFALESEIRKAQLDVGPIRYIAEVISSGTDVSKNIEFAVKIFTLLIVITLDPLAVVLLVAANHSLVKQSRKPNVPPDNLPSTNPVTISSPAKSRVTIHGRLLPTDNLPQPVDNTPADCEDLPPAALQKDSPADVDYKVPENVTPVASFLPPKRTPVGTKPPTITKISHFVPQRVAEVAQKPESALPIPLNTQSSTPMSWITDFKRVKWNQPPK